MDRAIAIAAFGFPGGNAEDDFFSGLHGDHWLGLPVDLVAAVVVGGELNHARLRLTSRDGAGRGGDGVKQEDSRRGSARYT